MSQLHPQRFFGCQRGKVLIFHLALAKCKEKGKDVRERALVLMATPPPHTPVKPDANGGASL